jgi:hypothetical protein
MCLMLSFAILTIMNKYLKLILKTIGVLLLLGVALIAYFILTFDMDLTHCRETNAKYQLEQGYVEQEIGQLYLDMYAKEFDLDLSEIRSYTQLASTTSDFTVGHVYLKSPEGTIYACGWFKRNL